MLNIPNYHSPDETISVAAQPPFVLEHRLEDPQPNGDFRPSTALWMTTRLRSGGLLRELPGEELKTLLLVFTYLTSQGGFSATPELVASALSIPRVRALARLERLCALQWRDQPLLAERPTESGLRFFSPSEALFEERTHLVMPAPPPGGVGQAVMEVFGAQQPRLGGHREQIISHSRQNYARPRAEVEAGINRFLNQEELSVAQDSTPETRQKVDLLRRLTAHGIAMEHAESLVQSYPAERIQRQLEWLPHRPARNPAALLKAAIEHDYESPAALRLVSSLEPAPVSAPTPEAPLGMDDVPRLQLLDEQTSPEETASHE